MSGITLCEGSFETYKKYGRSNKPFELDLNVYKERFTATYRIIAELGGPSRDPLESVNLFVRLKAGQF